MSGILNALAQTGLGTVVGILLGLAIMYAITR